MELTHQCQIVPNITLSSRIGQKARLALWPTFLCFTILLTGDLPSKQTPFFLDQLFFKTWFGLVFSFSFFLRRAVNARARELALTDWLLAVLSYQGLQDDWLLTTTSCVPVLLLSKELQVHDFPLKSLSFSPPEK